MNRDAAGHRATAADVRALIPVLRPSLRSVAGSLADVLLDGEWEADAMVSRVTAALDRPGRWVRQLVRITRLSFPVAPHDSPESLRRVILAGPPLPHVAAADALAGRPLPTLARRPLPARVVALQAGLPRWDGVGDLAAYLGLTVGELAWFADTRGYEARVRAETLRHYRYRLLQKRIGGCRLIESPKWQLREIQRRILHEVLDQLPVHDAAHGFRPGRSVIGYVEPHAGRRVVIHLDLRDFFARVGAGRVWSVFRWAGYPDAVAHVLTGLCTNVSPTAVRSDVRRTGALRLAAACGTVHLPAGAPTSPALANLCAYALDRRLAGLARRVSMRYTRYADDLAFSGGRSLLWGTDALIDRIAAIAAAEGFPVNSQKTAVLTASRRQRLAGVVVNDHPNLDRREFDALRATLHNCVHSGPSSQNRGSHQDFRAHLTGRVSWACLLNPAKGTRLERLLEQIDWAR